MLLSTVDFKIVAADSTLFSGKKKPSIEGFFNLIK